MSLVELLKRAQNFTNELRKVAVSFGPVIQEIKEGIDNWKVKYEESYPHLKEAVEEIGQDGWLIPPHMGITEVLDMIVTDNKKSFFEKFYEDNSNYEEMKRDLLEWDLIDKGLMEECFFCYECQKYKILIPSLFVEIEAFLGSFLETNNVGRGLSKAFERKIKKQEDNSIVFLQLHAASSFTNEILDRHEFDEERLEILNRAWVMHGKDSSEYWTQTEAIKLFNALYAFKFVTEIMEEE